LSKSRALLSRPKATRRQFGVVSAEISRPSGAREKFWRFLGGTLFGLEEKSRLSGLHVSRVKGTSTKFKGVSTLQVSRPKGARRKFEDCLVAGARRKILAFFWGMCAHLRKWSPTPRQFRGGGGWCELVTTHTHHHPPHKTKFGGWVGYFGRVGKVTPPQEVSPIPPHTPPPGGVWVYLSTGHRLAQRSNITSALHTRSPRASARRVGGCPSLSRENLSPRAIAHQPVNCGVENSPGFGWSRKSIPNCLWCRSNEKKWALQRNLAWRWRDETDVSLL